MRKLEIGEPSRLLSELRKAVPHSEDGVVHRLHCLLLLALGHDCHRLAEWFDRDLRTLERWVHRYETLGVEGLREKPKPGRPGRLDGDAMRILRRDLAKAPERLGYAQTVWDGNLLAEHIGQRFGVSLGSRQCQRLLRVLNGTRSGPSKASPKPH